LEAERAHRRARLRAEPKSFPTTPPASQRPVRWQPRWASCMRGDIYRLKAPKAARSHEQAGARYGVVVESDDLPLPNWVVAPSGVAPPSVPR
jgi:hypothetical protein